MSKHVETAPWHVFDSNFGRQPVGVFTRGPVDAFKVRACCTLFAAAAHAEKDSEVHAACLAVLAFFNGDCSYSDMKSGSAPDQAGKWTNDCVPLQGHDPSVLELIGVSASVCQPMS